MNYKIYLITFLALISMLSCTAQYGIQKGYAYRTIIRPGTISTGGDDNGNRVKNITSVKYTVYLETRGSVPIWNKAIVSGKTYQVTVQQVTELPYRVGVAEKDQKAILLKPKAGNKLWQVDLTLPEGKPGSSASSITLYGKYKNKNISYRLKSIVALNAPEYY